MKNDILADDWFAQFKSVIERNQSFVIMSHVRPDGDAIGSQIALGTALQAVGKDVFLINEDGMPENLAFLKSGHLIQQSTGKPFNVDVAISLDTATKERLGEQTIKQASQAKLWVNIDHHRSNPRYGDMNWVDSESPATGQIIYDIIQALDLPLTDAGRDAIYVAISTDTGSFQYTGSTAKTYRIAADLIDHGLQIGEINTLTYDQAPYRKIELLRALLNTLEIKFQGQVAHWELPLSTRHQLGILPEDSEGLIDTIRSIQGVKVAIFFEEIDQDMIRVSMRSKDMSINVCDVALKFGGGGHALAAGIRMKGSLAEVKELVLVAFSTNYF